jgi:capsular polysaccharide biosynthesis protein
LSIPTVPLRRVELGTAPELTVAELLRPGARGRAVAGAAVEPHACANSPIRVAGGAAGTGIACWRSLATTVCRTGESFWAPRFGMLVSPGGEVWRPTIGGPWTDPPRLAKAPGLEPDGDGYQFTPPEGAPEIAAAGVFMPWGAGFNYGHFLLDGLACLQALDASGLSAELPPHAPRLRPWQRELIGYLRETPVAEVDAPVVRLGEAAFADGMDHYLHSPNALSLQVRERILARAPAVRRALPRRIYFSRRGFTHTMRIMLNERALERALMQRGFLVVHAEHLSPRRQIALMRTAEVVVGASGAALANALFAPPGARIVDIQPEVFASGWVCALGALIGQHSYAYRTPAPVPLEDVPWVRKARAGFRFAYRTPLADFLPWLDALL